MALITTQETQDDRTKRLFVLALGSALGVPEQSYVDQDMYPVGMPSTGFNQVYGGAGYGIEGQAVSQASQAQNLLPLLIIVAGVVGVAWLMKG